MVEIKNTNTHHKTISRYNSIIASNANFLFTLANDTMLVESAQAQALLQHAGLAEYPPVVYPPTENTEKSVVFHNTIKQTSKDYLSIHPNPAKNTLFVEYAIFNYDENSNYKMDIFTQKGQKVETIPIYHSTNLLTVNIQNLTTGNYIIKLNNTSVNFTKL